MWAKDPGVTFRPMHRSRFKPSILTLCLLLALASAAPLYSQEFGSAADREDQVRVGILLGGTGFLGLLSEYHWGDWSAELILGTVSLRELSLALTAKRYFSGGRLRPAVGAGLWGLAAWRAEGSGSLLLFRAPVALDWRVQGGHAVGLELALNRAVAVDRVDPEDDTPPNPRLVPFPGTYYRYGWRR